VATAIASLRRRRRGSSVTATPPGSDAGVELGDVDTMIRARGLNPAEWDVERVKVNEWESYAGRNEPTASRRR
jgi:hypothetical protein